MKRSGVFLSAAAVMVAFGLQGCATTGGQTAHAPDTTWEATGAQDSIVTEPSKNQPVVKADTQDNFDAVEAAIKKQMQPGGRWQYVNADERRTIDANFASMQKLFGRYGSVDQMNPAAKASLLADQNSINAILTKKDGDRLICQMQVRVGTHLPVKTCQTYAEIQAQQKQAQEWMRQHSATMQNCNHNGQC